jgi:alkylation response protein AidB-like acyl-CoA dehydrogenase
MDFDDTPSEAAFRAEARAWLQANAPHQFAAELEASPFGRIVLKEADVTHASRAWQRRKAEDGWACVQWPKAYGGRGATPIERVIWQQEEGVFAKLSHIYAVGHGMCGPTLMAYADEARKRRYLPPLASGVENWCQLFSEPGAGSDLAGLRTRAHWDGDAWVINGQKIWTSFAHLADYGLILTRTDPQVPKHAGLTMFVLNMGAPGVEVRPIKQADGGAEFNEVFFTDVRISDGERLGAVGAGWSVALTTLMNERLSIGSGMPTGFDALFDLCCRLDYNGTLAIDDRAVRGRLASWAVRTSGLKYTAYRAISALSRGELPGPENSIGKLVAGTTMQEIAAYAVELQGAAGILTAPEDAVASGQFQAMLLRSPATRVEGGTDEILRSIIAERVLGLPADVRVDKDVPFDRIKTHR